MNLINFRVNNSRFQKNQTQTIVDQSKRWINHLEQLNDDYLCVFLMLTDDYDNKMNKGD